jgi:hypothetical protein
MRQRVFFAGIVGDVVFTGTGRVDKLNFNVFTDAFEMTIAPQLPGIRSGGAAAFPGRAIVGAAGRMRLDLIRRAPDNVDVAAVGFAPRNAGGKVFVGVGEAAVVLFLEWINGRLRIVIAIAPENFLKLIAFLFSAKLQEARRSCSVMISGTTFLSQSSSPGRSSLTSFLWRCLASLALCGFADSFCGAGWSCAKERRGHNKLAETKNCRNRRTQ